MRRPRRRIGRYVGVLWLLAAVLIWSGHVRAADDRWSSGVSGDWNDNARWEDGSSPVGGEAVYFDVAGTYTITLTAPPPAIENLWFTQGNVTLTSSGGSKTLDVSSGSVPGVGVLGGTTNFGTSGNSVTLNAGQFLIVNTGGTANVKFGSLIQTDELDLGTTGNGTMTVDGAGSKLLAGSTRLGDNGATGTLTFQNGSTGNSLGSIDLSSPSVAGSTGSISVLSGSTITSMANFSAGTGGLSGQSGTLTIGGTGSAVTQIGSSTITLGAAANSTGTINIGTTVTGGTFTTGTGLLTINKTGTVNIGSGANTGILNANGNVTIDGGVLNRGSGSQFNLAAGETMMIQNGGRASFTGPLLTGGATYDVSGSGSVLQTLSSSPGAVPSSSIQIFSGGRINVTNGARLVSNSFIDVGTSGNGTLSVSGEGSAVTANTIGGSSYWGANGSTATVTFSDSATGEFNGINMPGGHANSTAVLNVHSGARVTNLQGDFDMGSFLLTGASATMNITGANSAVTQIFPTTIVGHATNGTATINIGTTATGGSFNAGAGTLTINRTGTVNVGNGANTGTLNANGNVTITGGVLNRGTGSQFNLATGRTMTIQSGGWARFTGSYTTANATYSITGSGSLLQTLSAGALEINNGAQVNASGGGDIASASRLDVGTSGNGTLSVSGSGSSAIAAAAGGMSSFGANGNTATVTFSSSANGQFPGGILLPAGSANSSGILNVQTSATLTNLGSLDMGSALAPGASGTLSITGGAVVTQAGSATTTVGHATNGAATINIGTAAGGGTLNTGTGLLTINKTGTVNIGSGSNAGILNTKNDVTIDGGVLNRRSGSQLNLASTRTMTIQNGGRASFTGSFTASSGVAYTVIGSGSLLEAGSLTINSGGRLYAYAGGDIVSTSFLDIATSGTIGVLSVEGPGSSVSANVSGGTSFWGAGGNTAAVGFGSGANGQFPGGIRAAVDSSSYAYIDVLSGATLTNLGNLDLASGSGTHGTMTIAGTNSAVTQVGAATTTIGHAISGSAELNIGTTISGGAFSTGTGLFTINKTGTVNVGSGSGSNSGVLNVNGPAVNHGAINIGEGSPAMFAGNLDGTGNTTVKYSGTLTASRIVQNSLSILGVLGYTGAQATIRRSGGAPQGLDSQVSVVNSLSLSHNGATIDPPPPGGYVAAERAYFGNLDLVNNDLIIKNGTPTLFAEVQDMIRAANFGVTGITSSEAIAGDYAGFTWMGSIYNGFDDDSDSMTPDVPIFTDFDGVSLVGGEIIVKYTWFGDANLDGVVDGLDTGLLSAGFNGADPVNQAKNPWLFGDFDYNGIVEGIDSGLVSAGYFGGGDTLHLPEPGSLLLAALGAAGLVLCRARSHSRRAA